MRVKYVMTQKVNQSNDEESRYEMVMIFDAKKAFVNCRQKAKESLQEYTKRFNIVREILQSHLDGTIILPAEWTNKVGENIVSSRYQIPLRLGYALTVHKSQGMTIPHLVVNLSDTFEYGQGYVALSRATSLRKLLLIGFTESCFRAHPKVKEFYSMLEGKRPESVSVITPPNHSTVASKPGITQEQRRRMEENRQRAIEIRRKKQKQADNLQESCDLN